MKKTKLKKSKFGYSALTGEEFKSEREALEEMNIPFYVECLLERVDILEDKLDNILDCLGNVRKDRIK